MLRVLGNHTRACDGLTRRELLHVGGLSLLSGLTFATPAPAVQSTNPRPSGRARAVILIDLFGGPSHLDSFDPKPGAPAEVRGEFGSIATSLPGLRVAEHLPRLARWMHRTTLVRTLSHPYNSHNPYAVM